MIVLDASIVIAALNRREPAHETATALLSDATRGPFVIHQVNLAEVLVGAARAGQGAALASDLAALGIVVAEQTPEDALRLAMLRARTGLKMPDCCALAVAQRHGATLATSDHALADAARAEGLETLP